MAAVALKWFECGTAENGPTKQLQTISITLKYSKMSACVAQNVSDTYRNVNHRFKWLLRLSNAFAILTCVSTTHSNSKYINFCSTQIDKIQIKCRQSKTFGINNIVQVMRLASIAGVWNISFTFLYVHIVFFLPLFQMLTSSNYQFLLYSRQTVFMTVNEPHSMTAWYSLLIQSERKYFFQRRRRSRLNRICLSKLDSL